MHFRPLLVCLTLFALMGCPAGPADAKKTAAAPADPNAPSAADTAEATKIFQERCTVCHGATGAGDGAASAGLDPKPRNLTEAAWQGSVTDDYIEAIIKSGGTAVGKSAAMPGNPDLAGKPGVVAALRVYVRGLAR